MKTMGRPKKFSGDTHRFHIVLPKELYEKLKVIAATKLVPTPIAHLIQEILTQYAAKK